MLNGQQQNKNKYLNASVLGYMGGLIAAFTANEVMHRGMFELLYPGPVTT